MINTKWQPKRDDSVTVTVVHDDDDKVTVAYGQTKAHYDKQRFFELFKPADNKPKAGDIWRFEDGEVFVFAVNDEWVDYLWGEGDKVRLDSTRNWHAEYVSNVFEHNAEYVGNVFEHDDEFKQTHPDWYAETKAKEQEFIKLGEKPRKNPKGDPINPSHYTTHQSGIECIEITEHLSFCLGNCFKYLYRAGKKGDMVEDLKKAAWYAERAYLNGESGDMPDAVKNKIAFVADYTDNEIIRRLMVFMIARRFEYPPRLIMLRDKINEAVLELTNEKA